MYGYFKKIVGGDYISLWKSKGLSDEIIKPTTSDNSLLQHSYIGAKTRVKFDGSCFKQDKITFTLEKTVKMYTVY